MEKLDAVELKIIPSQEKTLTSNQEIFNKLTSQIEKLEMEVDIENQKMDNLLEQYNLKLHPLQLQTAKNQIRLAKIISESTYSIKFSKSEKEKISNVILALLNKSFSIVEPDEEGKKLYNEWSDSSLDEESQIMESDAKELIASMMKERFGVDLDLSSYDSTSESQARLQAFLKEVAFKAETEMNEKFENSKSKSSKTSSKNKKQREEQALQLKSIRSIYIALAKILHPDKEINEEKKLEKQELMKKVTVAYERKDLATLLKYEMEWIKNDNGHLEQISDNILKLYINILKQKIDELKETKYMIIHNPRYHSIITFVSKSEKKSIQMLREEISFSKGLISQFEHVSLVIEKNNEKHIVMQFVNDYEYVLNSEYLW